MDGATCSLGLLWLLWAVALTAVLRQTAQEQTVFDPFAILGVSEDATEKQIKKAYKLGTVKWYVPTLRCCPLCVNLHVDGRCQASGQEPRQPRGGGAHVY